MRSLPKLDHGPQAWRRKLLCRFEVGTVFVDTPENGHAPFRWAASDPQIPPGESIPIAS